MANNLRPYRLKAQMTQEELAKEAGLSPSFISLLEKGKRRTAKIHTALAICEALGRRIGRPVSVTEVFPPDRPVKTA